MTETFTDIGPRLPHGLLPLWYGLREHESYIDGKRARQEISQEEWCAELLDLGNKAAGILAEAFPDNWRITMTREGKVIHPI